MSDDMYSVVASEIEAAHDLARDAFKRKDLAAYMEVFAPALVYVQPDGKAIGRDQLARDVKEQLSALGSVENAYERESLVVEGERATEMLRQTASIELVHFGVIRRNWELVRRGRYLWKKLGGEWRIAEVEVLEEKVTSTGTRFGLR